jgi:hypothetical protein
VVRGREEEGMEERDDAEEGAPSLVMWMSGGRRREHGRGGRVSRGRKWPCMTRDSTAPPPPLPQFCEILRFDIVRFLRFFVWPPPPPPSPFFPVHLPKRGRPHSFFRANGQGSSHCKGAGRNARRDSRPGRDRG